jgi:hypothetical protein
VACLGVFSISGDPGKANQNQKQKAKLCRIPCNTESRRKSVAIEMLQPAKKELR